MSKTPLPTRDNELKAYIEHLNLRLSNLEEDAKRLIKEFHEKEEHLEQIHGEFTSEITGTREDIRKIESELTHLVKETGKLVQGFKNSTRRTQLENVSQRVDAWKGEQYISRDELKRVLNEEF